MKSYLIGVGVLFALYSCGGSSYGGGGGYTSPVLAPTVLEVTCSQVAPTGSVNIQATTFAPVNETIMAGGIVIWTNNDLITHTITSGTPGAPDGKFDLTIPAATTKCLKFTGAGTFNYYSKSLASMTAVILVQ